jgi:hypothetical protein
MKFGILKDFKMFLSFLLMVLISPTIVI